MKYDFILNKFFNYFFSIQFALILMSFYALAIGVATFIENDYGTVAAKATVFNTWWLELCLILLVSIFLFNIYKYKLLSTKRLPVLFFHLSFILIIIGAGITRYIGEEGVMRIREGSFNNKFVSETTYLDFKIHDNISEFVGKKDLLLSSISNNNFSIPINFSEKKIKIEYLDFINDPTDKLTENSSDGREIMELIVPDVNGGMKSEYLEKNTQKKINSLVFSFDLDNSADFNILKEDSVFYFLSMYDVSFMKMSNQKRGILESNKKHILSKKTLYTINGKNVVFKNYFNNAKIEKVAASMKNNKEVSDLLRLKISVNDSDTIIDLIGNKGLVSPKNYFTFKNLFFSLGYGSKSLELPFAIYLYDFQLERYPGSDSPSSFASEIQVLDGDNKFDYRIFMNNVLNYKGYRFFQSSYDSDEKGTILSVNKDKPGTIVTYLGYLFLMLSVFSLVLSRFSRLNILSKKIKTKN